MKKHLQNPKIKIQFNNNLQMISISNKTNQNMKQTITYNKMKNKILYKMMNSVISRRVTKSSKMKIKIPKFKIKISKLTIKIPRL